MPIPFVKEFDPNYGQAVILAPNIRRLTAPNPSPFTFKGTNSFLIGTDTLALIDPGPNDKNHLQTLLKHIDSHPLSHIFVTHCHLDHCGLAKKIAQHTGAKIVAVGRYRHANNEAFSNQIILESGSQIDFKPDIDLKDGQTIEGDGWAITSVTTPGHMASHTAFALANSGILFTGDHVMAWSTTVIAPPEGSMRDYMHSLDKLLKRHDKVYLPGHGGAVYKPHHFVRALKTHRKIRECAIFNRLAKGDCDIKTIVQTLYRDTDPKLHKAAALSVFAHLEDLVARNLVKTKGAPSLYGHYSIS
ncbi:MBL fold metallo-hydrolase [Bartonella tamiae]|uniref:Metallo-beta-lactamase domain-containing protein n=1 Tax=Bartonella tamiae Th239 TaxID=1094558 RepID=J0ZPN6_9HYPH|nr:MBL fold metallo-hydrolase [Bartonella tamiae]EJF90553.1 hypothetical protein ME5_00954 [Bartonella tamiae Th239]EJF94069.1 hypothetical protein MEG_00927 [Bartonella tamiae Th307]